MLGAHPAGALQEDHPGDWREQHQRWNSVHWVRVAIILAGFVLTLVAVAAW